MAVATDSLVPVPVPSRCSGKIARTTVFFSEILKIKFYILIADGFIAVVGRHQNSIGFNDLVDLRRFSRLKLFYFFL